MRGVKDEKVRSHLSRMDKITEQAAELTRKLLGFARKGKYVDTVFDLNDLLREAIDLFMPASQGNMDLRFESKVDSPRVKGDRVQLQQVFLNILINARDAMENVPDDQTRLEVAIEDGANVPGHRPASGRGNPPPAKAFWVVTIKDYGEGMDRKTLSHLFEPFFTTKPTGKGTGMGLAMVYGTITNHGGFVDVKSSKGKGALFRVFLPKAPASETPNGNGGDAVEGRTDAGDGRKDG
jgi:signal transduction histidine kinase